MDEQIIRPHIYNSPECGSAWSLVTKWDVNISSLPLISHYKMGLYASAMAADY